jgi:hypothetical protein
MHATCPIYFILPNVDHPLLLPRSLQRIHQSLRPCAIFHNVLILYDGFLTHT